MAIHRGVHRECSVWGGRCSCSGRNGGGSILDVPPTYPGECYVPTSIDRDAQERNRGRGEIEMG